MKDARVFGQDSTGTDVALKLDASRALIVTLSTTIAGEDITNDVLKVEERYTAANISTGVGTTVKNGAGFVKHLTINNAGSSWEIDVYDGTTSAGTSLGKIRSAAVPTTLHLNVSFATGLFIDTVKGTTVGDITVAYR